jgi:acetyl esterase/lipase
MEAALRKAGVDTELVRLPGGPHTFFLKPNPQWPDFIGKTKAWLDAHLMDRRP